MVTLTIREQQRRGNRDRPCGSSRIGKPRGRGRQDQRGRDVYKRQLLDYLNYDPTYIKLFVRTYNSQYDILEELKQPKEIQYAKQRKIQKEVRKAIWLYKIKNFWNK